MAADPRAELEAAREREAEARRIYEESVAALFAAQEARDRAWAAVCAARAETWRLEGNE